jgi:outer membrane receptor protein involved in Fe transport
MKKSDATFLPVMLVASILSIFSIKDAAPGTTGKIAGVVQDQDTRTALADCQIIIEGTALVATTDAGGRYFLLQVPPGVYTVTASLSGYGIVKIANVKVSMDLTTTVNFALAAQVTEPRGETVLMAERPLVQRDNVASMQIFDADLIESMAADHFKEVLTLSSSVTTSQIRQNSPASNDESGEGLFFVRSGRGNELALMVDGVNSRDAITGGLGTEISNAAIAELQLPPGHFNAEYGNAMSGVVNLATLEGGPKTSFTMRGFTDAIFGQSTADYTFKQRDQTLTEKGRLDRANWGTYQGQFSLGGSLPGFNDKVRYFAAGEYFETAGYIGVLQDEFARRGTAKLSFFPSTRNKLTLTTHAYSKDQEIYEHAFAHQGLFFQRVNGDSVDNNFAGNDRLSTRVYQGIAAWAHTLNSKAFFELKLQYFTRRFFDRVRGDPRDYRFLFFNPSEEFAITGDDPRFLKQEDRLWQGKFDLTHQWRRHHELKAGIDYGHRRVWRRRLLFTGDISNQRVEENTFYPIEAAAYLQDKMEYKHLVINAGLRLDYFDISQRRVARAKSPLTRGQAAATLLVNPRLGMAHAINERMKLYFSYGVFCQFPEYGKIVFSQSLVDSILRPVLSNVDLEPQKMTGLEVGWEQQITEFMAISATGFYKDFGKRVFSYVDFNSQPLPVTYSISYLPYDSRGVEINLRLKRRHHFAAYLGYTLSRTEGNSAPFDTRDDLLSQPPMKQVIVDWNRPHVFDFNIDFRYGKDEGPIHWLQNFGVNLTGRFASGLPYTPTDTRGRPITEENSARRPSTWQLDLRAEKLFAIGRTQLGVFTEILNLTNRCNVVEVFTDSGLPDCSRAPGLTPEGQRNPYNIGPQRNIRLGVEVSL